MASASARAPHARRPPSALQSQDARSTTSAYSCHSCVQVASPMHGLFGGARQRLCADIVVDHLAQIAGLWNLPELDELVLHPAKFVHRQRQVGRDRFSLYRVVKDVSRARVVGLGAGDHDGELNGLVAMVERVTQRLPLRGGITAPV